MSKIKTFQDACKALKIDSKTLPVVTGLDRSDAKAVLAQYKLAIIARALNDGWKPNWKNHDEWKYYPWFEMDGKSGFRFDDVFYLYSTSNVGSLLCFRSRELAQYAGKTFIKLYKDLMVV